MEHTVIKSAANAKLEVVGQYSLWKGCHSGPPRQAGGTGRQEPHEIQEAKCKVLHLGRKSLLQRYRLGTGCMVIGSREGTLGQQAGLELVASPGSRDGRQHPGLQHRSTMRRSGQGLSPLPSTH